MSSLDRQIFPAFDRRFFESDADFSVIGGGSIGGKATGLAYIHQIISDHWPSNFVRDVEISIPRLTVITTELFEQFMLQNDLYKVALSGAPDERIAHAFQEAELPTLLVGDLWALISRMHTPLAVRSSSLLEDQLHHPFAGTYETKMIPNNQIDAQTRFHRLVEAIKLIYASTFFRGARNYMRSIGRRSDEERMAVIIQEVVGQRCGERFYPTLSAVVRTYNYYPTGPAAPEDGVVNLALGLGKSIVDGGVSWTYSPRYPRHVPPFGSVRDQLQNTQTRFWAVNLAPPPVYDPINEAEYLVEASLSEAEQDGMLKYLASTYDVQRDRLVMGMGVAGPRVLNFAPTLDLEDVPLNRVIEKLAAICREVTGSDVELELAVTFNREEGLPARVGLLQMRPMMVSQEAVEITADELADPATLVATDLVMGHGCYDQLCDVIYVEPEAFEARLTPAIAAQIDQFNRQMLDEGRHFVLIGFGRWGSSDSWLGIPVTWPMICNARVIVEATTPEMNTEASQGSHFFHNMLSFRVHYLTVRHGIHQPIDWTTLRSAPEIASSGQVHWVRFDRPLLVKVDGRNRCGVIRRT
ncbi:MAG: hypothetical protein HJJLKODD_00597 [Phycisphaerae bacterium]|nr:hypothetical protein [Phycisphaerae bacterium]